MMQYIDLDTHMIEPWDLWEKYIDKRFRINAPRAVKDSWGMRRLMIESRLYPKSEGPGRSPRVIMDSDRENEYQEQIARSQCPEKRLEAMTALGIDKAVLLPSQGCAIASIRDAELAYASARAYNIWLSEFASENTDRLLPASIIPLQSVDYAMAELKHCVEVLQHKAVFLRPNPVGGRNLLDPAYTPFFEMCEAYNVPVLIHEATGFAPDDTVAIDRFENGLFSHIISHPFEIMLSCLSLIVGGVLERCPRLRVAFLEAGAGWAPFWLDRLDSQVELISWEAPWLTMKPSDYFKRQCVVSCEPDEEYLGSTIAALGSENIVLATDYPHADFESRYIPSSPCLENLPENVRRQLLHDNAIRILEGRTP